MKLRLAEWMKFFSCFRISCGGVFFSREVTQVFHLPVNLYLRMPAPRLFVPHHTADSALTMPTSLANVLNILGTRCQSEIGDFIVRLDFVSVVNFSRWPLPVYIQPSETVRFVCTPGNSDAYISLMVNVPSLRSGDGPFFPFFPHKHPGLRIVVQQRAKQFCGKFHDSLQAAIDGMFRASRLGLASLAPLPGTEQEHHTAQTGF